MDSQTKSYSDRSGHPGNQVGIRGFQDQMVMVAHQAKRMDLPIGLLTGLGQRLEEVVPVHIVEEDVVALVAAAHHVIHSPGVLKSKLARHAEDLNPSGQPVKSEAGLFLRSDPADAYFVPNSRLPVSDGSFVRRL